MKWKLIKADGVSVKSRHGHRAVAVNDGIIIYGGGKRKICNQLHIYKVIQNKNILPMLTGKICPGVAAFGVVKTKNDKLILFGGMLEYRVLSNTLYSFDTINYYWSTINNVKGQTPDARLGHSFTLVDDNRIFLFGGITNIHNNPRKECYRYMNDLYVLHNHSKNKYAWEKVETATQPSPRESHSAVFYHNNNTDQKHLIIFGGMNADFGRLGDLWFLDVDQMVWMNFDINGIPPSPRSLHSANIIGSRMYVFGGIVKDDEDDGKFITSNTLCSLDLIKNEWNTLELENGPNARAAHAAVATNNRLYIFNGRHQYTFDTKPECLDDSWYLEIENPLKVEKVEMTRCSTKHIEITWDRVPNANCYLIEIRRVQDILPKIAIKFVNNVKQAQQNEKRKSDVPVLISIAKKVKPIEVPQIDGCNDEVEQLKIKEELLKEAENPLNKYANNAVYQLANAENGWCTVGVFKNNFCNIEGYFCFTFVKEGFNEEKCPQNIAFPKIPLKSNTMYAFRIFSVNSCGVGESCKIVAFRTFPEGWPSAPQNCKIIGTPGGIRLCWTPLPLSERIRDYNVSIGEKNAEGSVGNFVRLYTGNQPTFEIKNLLLKNPAFHMSNDNRKNFMFRITATNENGTGPSLNVKLDISHEMLLSLEKIV